MANDWRNEYITKLTGGANNSTLNNYSGDWRQEALNTIQAEQEKAEKKRKADALMAKASSVLTPDPIYDYTGASKKKTKTPTPQINADKSSVINLGLGPLSSEAVSEGVASGKFKAETDKNGKTTVSNNPNFETPAKKAQIIDATDRISPNAPRKTNWGKLLKGTVKKGLGQSAESLITIPDELLGGFAQEAWYMFGLDKLGEKIWGNDLNPLSALREDVSRNNALDNEYFADAAGTSKFAQKVDEYGTATIAALPQLLAAFMTGGTSLAASATASTETLSRQAAQSVAKGWSQVQGMLGNSARTMLKNPNYQTSFLMEAGNAYNEAVNDGASEAEATLYALTYGAFSAMIEVGGADEALGGIQKLPIQLRDAIEKGEKNGVMMWVKNAVEEGMEEVQQGAIGRAFKGMYGEDVPIYSENDDNAIINPGAMKDDFMGGLVVGGVLSGGTAAVRKGAQGAQTLARNETLRRTFDGYQRNLVEIGLKQPEGSRANELAKEYNTQLNETSKPLSGRQTAKLYDSIMDARENRSEINAINEDVIGQAMDMPEGSRAHTLADSLRTKQLEGEEITSNEMEKLRQAMNEKEEVLPLVSSEEYDTAQKFKADYAQAYDDGLISESAIYDAAISITEGRTEAEAAEAIVEEIERSANKKLRDNFRNEIRDGTISGEEINTYSKAVASGMAMDKAIRLADLTIEERIDNEAGKQSADTGMGRQPDMGAGEQAGRVREDTVRAEENKRTERSSKGAERKDIPKADRISSKEAGLRNGTDAKNLEVISEERLHPATQRIMKAFSSAANGITAVKGRFETRHGTIQGVTTADGKVIFRTDTAYGQEAILLHECGHLYIRDDSSLKAALKDACTEAMTENELRELSMKYGSLWQGLMSESMTDDEFLDMMLEEIYCDALAGIDRIRARGAGKLTEAVRSVFEQETGIDVDALLNDVETAKTEAKTETAKAPAKETRNNGPPKYSYGGENARTANFEELDIARRLDADGESAETIFRETGWYKGMDGKWRFEIDDSGMEFRKDGDARLMREDGYRRLSELTDKWAESFQNGTELTDYELAEMERLQDEYSDAVWEEKYMLTDFLRHDELFKAYPKLKGVSLRFVELPSGTSGFFSKRSNTIVLSDQLFGRDADTLIHELQHVIQSYEGFTKGSSPKYWNERMEEGYSKRWDTGEEMMPSELYRNTAGEIEARDAAERRSLTAEQRRTIMPKTADENTVFAENNDSSFSIREIKDKTGEAYGRGVYLDSTLLENLTDSERIQMVKERVRELGGQHFTAYDSDGKEVDIQIANPSTRFTNKSGKSVPVNKDLTTKNRKSKIKQEAVVLADELITTAQHRGDHAARHPHGWLDDNGRKDWSEWKTYIQDKENTVWEATLHVATSANGEKILYDIDPIKKTGQSGNSDTSTAEHIVAERTDDVKSKYSIDDDLPINLQLVLNGDFESRNNEVHIGTTSNFLTNAIGAEALELYMPAEKAYRAMATEEKAIFDGKQTGEGINYHGLDVDGLVNILKASEEPIAAFAASADEGGKRENRIVLVTDVEAKGGLGVVIEEVDTFAHKNGNRIKANKAITVYPKGNASSAIREAVADGRILYLDEKRSQAHLPIAKGSNYPTVGRKADFTDNIRRFWANVKWKKSGKTNFTAQGNTNELPEWKKRLAEFSERYSAEDEGLRVRAEKMSQNTLKERLARVEGLIHGYEMSENLTERAQEELETLRHNREIYKEAIEKKKQKAKNDRADERKAGREAAEKMKASPSAITKSANKFADSVLDTFNVTESRGEVRGFINATLNEWRNRGHFTKQDVISLEDKLLTYGQERVEAEDTAREVRLYAQASHIYVSPRIVAEFGDDWKSFRNKAFGAGIYLSTRNESFRGVDTHYMEFAEAFGEGLFSETTDEKAMLEQIVNMAIDGKDENMSLYDYAKHLNKTEGGGEEFIDFMHNKLVEELKAFSKSAKVEMQVKADSAYQMAKDRAHREKIARDAQQRKIEVEQQKRALKQLQLLKRNSMTAPEDMKKQMEDVLRDINVITISTANAMNYSDKYEATWGDLADMYKWAKANDPNFLPTKELENIVNRVSGKSLDSMTPYEVEQIYKAAVALNTAYYNRNNYIGDELHRSYAEISESVKAEMADAKKPKHRYGKMRAATRDTYNPIQYLESLAGWNPDSVWYKTLSKGLETGERKMRRYQEEANQLLDKFIEENSEWMKKADGQGKDGIWYDIKIPQLIELKMGGKAVFGGEMTVSMTPLQKVMLALESKNTDNLAHMAGGRTFVDKELYMQGKTDEGLKGGTTVRLAPETVKAMVADLTTEEQALYDILAKYYNEFAKTRINEVSNTLYGYDRATSSFYAPIYTNANYNKTEPGVYDVTAEGVGNMKNRTQGAKNPSYNISAIEAFRRHVSQTSRFVGLAIPIQNFNAVLNRYVGESTIKDVITHEWSKADLDYINDIITELQASTHMEKTELEGAFGKIESGYIGAVFGFNPSVALKVFGSWFTAMGTLNPKYAVKSFGKVNEQVVNKYTAELALRQRGYSTPELAQMQMNRGKINEFIQSNKVTRDVFGGGWMVKADVAVAKNLWGWAEAQIEATTQLKPGTPEQIASGTDQFYKAVAELYEEAIGNTQSMYDVMHRSKLMKADGTIRAFTMFHTDTMQCLNLFYKNIGEARYYKSKAEADPNNKTLQKKLETAQGKVKDTFNAVALCSLEVALVTVLNSILKRRDKYEDEEGSFSWKAVGADTASNFLKSLTGMLPGIDVGLNALIDALFGDNTYDTQLPGMSMINDLVSTSIDLGKRAAERKLTRADMKDLAVALAKAAGLPVENVEKYLLGVMSWFSPDIAQAYDDLIVPPAKSDLKDLHGDAQERAVYDMLNEYGVDKNTAKEVARLYAAGYTKAMAGDIPEKITVDGEEFDIDPDRYKEALGETLSKLGEVISSSEYKNADDKAKADMLRRVNEFAHATAKADACNEYDPPAWVQGGQDLVDMGKGIMSVATMPYSPKKESSNDGEKDDTRFVKLVKGGVEYNNAADIEETLNNITPSNGKSTRDLDKLIAIAEMPIGEDEKDAAFKVLLSESSYKKYNQAMGTGLLSVQYADFMKALDRINDNSNVSQDEFVQAVDASGISHDAARQMWYARGWKKTSPWG